MVSIVVTIIVVLHLRPDRRRFRLISTRINQLTGNPPTNPEAPAYRLYLPALTYLMDQQETTVMVVHARADPHLSYDALADSTTRHLIQLAEGIQASNISVSIALEINRYHGVDIPGVTYDGLIEIVSRVNSDAIGYCWDMGHTQSSFQQQKLSAVPPPEFVRKVIHTHLHGLLRDGETHGPLTKNSEHMESIVRLQQI